MTGSEVRKRVWTLRELQLAHAGDWTMAESGGRELDPRDPNLVFSGPLLVHIGTTQPKKIDEFRAPLSAQPKNIRLANAVGSLGYWHCDPEESGTYIGNAAGKALSLIERLYEDPDLGYERFVRKLQRSGINPENFMFVVNDTGNSFSCDYSDEIEFDKSRDKIGPISWPGPELGPVTEAHKGIGGFFGDFKEMSLRKQALGEPVVFTGHDEVTYMFFRPAPDLEDVRFYSFSARTPVEFILDPEGYNGEVLTSQHFMKLRGDDVPAELRTKSIAEIKDEWLRHHSPTAQALRAFFGEVQVPLTYKNDFRACAVPGAGQNFTVVTQDNLYTCTRSDTPSLPCELPEGVELSTARYNHEQLDAMHHMMDNADAIVLTGHSENTLKDWNTNVLAAVDTFCGVVVPNQVCVETVYGKPIIVLQKNDHKFYHNGFTNGDLKWDDPATERAFLDYLDGIDPKEDPWLRLKMLGRYLHEKGAVKQEEHHLFTRLDPDMPDLGNVIEQKIIQSLGQRVDVPKYERVSYGHDRRDLFEVFIGGSAGTHAQDYINAAEELAYWCASQGFHVRTGGGNFGIMGAASRGVLRFIAEHPERAEQTHLSLIQTFRTIQFEGAALKRRDIEKMPNAYMAIEETFDTRMASLFRVAGGDATDPDIGTANVIMMGGLGTVQEANRWMQYRDAGVPHMQDQKLIMFNQRQAGDLKKRQIRVLDAIIHTYPEEIRDAHMDVQKDLKGVQAAILRTHDAWKLRTQPALGERLAAVVTGPSLHL